MIGEALLDTQSSVVTGSLADFELATDVALVMILINISQMFQVSTGRNWLKAVNCWRTYLAGPAEPV